MEFIAYLGVEGTYLYKIISNPNKSAWLQLLPFTDDIKLCIIVQQYLLRHIHICRK